MASTLLVAFLIKESKDVVVSPMYSTGVGLVLKGFEYMKQNPHQYDIATDVSNKDREKEKTNEPSLIDRISGWFIEDNID